MRQEVMERIMMCLSDKGITSDSISHEVTIILSDYEILPRETAVAIRNEDKNKYYLQKFIIAKTVKGCSEKTIQVYKKEIWKALCRINKQVEEITADDIRLYLAIRQRKDGVSKRTADNELRYLRSFFGYLMVEELISKNPIAKIERIKYDKKKKKAFTEMEVEKLRDSCSCTWETAVIETMLSTGCRVTELVNIRIDDIEGDQLIVHGKGNKDRTVYLNAKAVISIHRYLEERKDTNPYLFPGGFFGTPQKDCKNWYRYPDRVDPERHCDKGSVEAKVRRLGEKSGVSNVHPHRFRRTCATFALKRGMPIEQVSKMLGHEQINTTQIYLDLTEDELKQAHKKYVI
jgi:site-specific recombinase XerD